MDIMKVLISHSRTLINERGRTVLILLAPFLPTHEMLRGCRYASLVTLIHTTIDYSRRKEGGGEEHRKSSHIKKIERKLRFNES